MIYLDHHATTPVSSEVIDAMQPYWRCNYANAGSATHEPGRLVAQQVTEALHAIGSRIGCSGEEIVVTSGATESNNLALFGVCMHPRQKRKKIVTVATEHRSILDPARRLERQGWTVTRLPVQQQGTQSGVIDWETFCNAVDEEVALVSVMLANNEIGVIQPIELMAGWCRSRGVLLHTDASQAIGWIDVNVEKLDVDLLSFSAHKFHGPKGVGGLYVRNKDRNVPIEPQILGGGHQRNRRSGTLNVPGIIGMATAWELVQRDVAGNVAKVGSLRNRLWRNLASKIPALHCNGPGIEGELRLSNNLNCMFPNIEGQSLLNAVPEIAASTGSACSSDEPHPSHVLSAIGLTEDEVRSSLRFGLGIDNTEAEIDRASDLLAKAHDVLSSFQP